MKRWLIVDNVLDFGQEAPHSVPDLGKTLLLQYPCQVRKHTHTVSMGHGGAIRKFPNEAPWKTLSKPILHTLGTGQDTKERERNA